eukprot:TRINITY_DN929_c2_g1_i2.p1 TRINITY_DN929_c2_g1~~TRINITY_DN929_c2_g1_i2.p1  ORF type:complete len:203 (-),score=88.00 TRINITY_DN929_c2_g1_i2:202-810(-)
MKTGEISLFYIRHDYAYGETGCPGTIISSNADLLFLIELISFEIEPESVEDRLLLANKAKEQGNDLFRSNSLREALNFYSQGLEYFNNCWGLKEQEEKKVNALKAILHLNSSACKIKLSEFREALLDAEKSLDYDPENGKAFYRRAQANANLGNYDEAMKDFEIVVAKKQNTPLIDREIAQLKKQMDLKIQKERQAYSKLFE